MAEREGFEPSRGLHPWRFSRPLPSTARPPLLARKLGTWRLSRAGCNQQIQQCIQHPPRKTQGPRDLLARRGSQALREREVSGQNDAHRDDDGVQHVGYSKTAGFDRSATSPRGKSLVCTARSVQCRGRASAAEPRATMPPFAREIAGDAPALQPIGGRPTQSLVQYWRSFLALRSTISAKDDLPQYSALMNPHFAVKALSPSPSP